MSFKRSLLLVILVAVFLGGCASSAVRYTTDELKDYPLDVQERIMRGQVAPGMTHQQVRYAWGPPASVRTLDSLEGRSREEWMYSTTLGYKTRLLFINGKLNDITEGMFLKSGEQKSAQQEKK